MVEVQVVKRPSMYLLGVEGRIGNEPGEVSIADVWNCYFQNFERLFSSVTNRIKPEEEAEYAVALFDEQGKFIYFIGIEVENIACIPQGAVGRLIPPLLYAKATHVGPPAETLGQTLDYVYGDWFLNTTFRTGHLRDSPFAVIEYYDKRCSLTPPEMDIFVPIKWPTDNKIIEIGPFEAVYYRAVGNNAAKLKYAAFDVMINWVEKHCLQEKVPFRLGIKYGETDEYETYCEVFYKCDDVPGLITAHSKVKKKVYEGGTYAVAPGVHHFLEKDWMTFNKWLDQHPEYQAAGECYEEFVIENGKVHFYTTLQFYEKVEKRESPQ